MRYTENMEKEVDFARRQRRFSLLVLLIILLVVGVVVSLISDQARHIKIHLPEAITPTVQPGYYRVTEYDDGDTIKLDMNGNTETVRFIGVDTPETHDPRKAVQCFGEAASAHTKQLIQAQDGQVRLEADPLDTNRDRYNRLLRYVYLKDGTLLNAKIIEDGYGFAYPYFPFEKKAEFAALQDQAKQESRGLWSSCTPTPTDGGGYTANNATN